MNIYIYIYKTVLAASNISESEHLKCQDIQVDITVISTTPSVSLVFFYLILLCLFSYDTFTLFFHVLFWNVLAIKRNIKIFKTGVMSFCVTNTVKRRYRINF
jgi:hypothetical protein